MRKIVYSEQRLVLSGVLDLQLVGSVDAESADLRKIECATSVAGATPAPELVKFGGSWWNRGGGVSIQATRALRSPFLGPLTDEALYFLGCTFSIFLLNSGGEGQCGEHTERQSNRASTCSKGPPWSPKAQLPSSQGKRPEGWG